MRECQVEYIREAMHICNLFGGRVVSQTPRILECISIITILFIIRCKYGYTQVAAHWVLTLVTKRPEHSHLTPCRIRRLTFVVLSLRCKHGVHCAIPFSLSDMIVYRSSGSNNSWITDDLKRVAHCDWHWCHAVRSWAWGRVDFVCKRQKMGAIQLRA